MKENDLYIDNISQTHLLTTSLLIATDKIFVPIFLSLWLPFSKNYLLKLSQKFSWIAVALLLFWQVCQVNILILNKCHAH